MDDGVRPQASHLMLIASSLGPIVAVHASEEPPDASMLAEFVTETCLAPSHGEPRRPARVVTADGVIVTRLATELRPTGVRVQHGATPNAMDAYESLMDHLTMPKVADSLSQADNATVRAYFAAADRFYGSRPWEALAAEKFVAFRLEGRPWRYLSIMGHGGDEYGFAVYDDWLDACRMAYAHLPPYPSEWDDGPPDPFSAIDALEGVSLYGLDMASPADAAVIRKLKIRKTWNGQYALVQRFTDQGSVPAINALETYTAVMQVLGERADRARGRKVTSIKAQVDTVHGPVAISYPAKGTEDALPDSITSSSSETSSGGAATRGASPHGPPHPMAPSGRMSSRRSGRPPKRRASATRTSTTWLTPPRGRSSGSVTGPPSSRHPRWGSSRPWTAWLYGWVTPWKPSRSSRWPRRGRPTSAQAGPRPEQWAMGTDSAWKVGDLTPEEAHRVLAALLERRPGLRKEVGDIVAGFGPAVVLGEVADSVLFDAVADAWNVEQIG